MKIKSSTCLILLIGLATLIHMHFFYLGFSPSYSWLALVTIISVLFCIVFCNKTLKQMSHEMPFAYVLGFFMTACYLIEVLNTLIKFPKQGIRITLTSSAFFLAVLLIYPLGCWLLKRKDIKKLFDYANFIAFIWYVIVLAQKILYDTSLTVILNGYNEDGTLYTRNGNVRIDLMGLGNLMILYNFYQFYIQKGRNRFFHMLMAVIGCYELVVVQQTRVYTIIILACLFLMVLMDRNSMKGFIRKALMVILVVLILSQTDIVSNFIVSFASTVVSTTNRTYAIKYYLNYFLENPFLGMGFVHQDYYYSILRGTQGLAYMDDVGIIGQLARWGLLVIPVYIIPVVRCCHVAYIVYKRRDHEAPFYAALLLYMVGTSLTLIMLDSQRIIMYPLFIVVFEYKRLSIVKNETIGVAGYSLKYIK